MVLELKAMARESARAFQREREGSEAKWAAHELPAYCSGTQTESSFHCVVEVFATQFPYCSDDVYRPSGSEEIGSRRTDLCVKDASRVRKR